MKFFTTKFLLLILLTEVDAGTRTIRRRQAPFDELINSALQIVKPIFGSARQLATGKMGTMPQESPVKVRQKGRQFKMPNSGGQSRLSSARLRELDILGAPGREEQMMMMATDDPEEAPPAICQGNSRLCKFIACSAHNFKHNANFANLQLAAQLLGDKKLRRTVGANSGAIGDVCREHGMSGIQCSLFARAFQIIDRFMTTIEDDERRESVESRERDTEPRRPIVPINFHAKMTTTPQPPKPTTFDPFEPQNDEPEGTMPRPVPTVPMPSNGEFGSRTWSTLGKLPRALSSLDMARPPEIQRAPAHQIFRPVQVPSEPPRANLLDTRQTLISYSNPMVPSFPNDRNGTVILMGGGGTVPVARRVPEGASNFARPKQRHESGSSRSIPEGMQPLQVAHKTLIPYTHLHYQNTPPPTTTTTTTVSSIPEAAEFAEEDEEKQQKNNEISRWRRRYRDDGMDYYDEVSSSSTVDENSGNGTKNNGIGTPEDTVGPHQQLENCLQYLG